MQHSNRREMIQHAWHMNGLNGVVRGAKFRKMANQIDDIAESKRSDDLFWILFGGLSSILLVSWGVSVVGVKLRHSS